MRRKSILLGCIVCLLFAFVPSAEAEPPTLVQELVYALEVFDGVGYASSFAPQSEKTLYLIADQPSALSPRYTMVYYWAITRTYKTDWEELNELVEADHLDILRGQTIIQQVKPTAFSVSFPEGYGSRKSEVLWGINAEQAYQDYLDQRHAYVVQIQQYQAAFAEYQKEFDKYQDAMLDESVIEKPPAPIRPEEPATFVLVVTPPAIGYQIGLSEGNYRIRLMNAEEQIIPYSEKKVEVFAHRRQGVGYNIIPESRWTRPERSDDPQETIYVSGEGNPALYLQPFYEAEFNEAQYRGLLDPQDHGGSRDRWIWAHLETFGQANMALITPENDEELARLEGKSYSVIQMPGARLGYQVVEYEPEKMGGQPPTFNGFQLSLTDREGKLAIRLVDSEGIIIEGSQREVRWLPLHPTLVQYLWLCVPLLAGLVAFLYRRSRVTRMKRESPL